MIPPRLQKGIGNTLCYHSIFNYDLTSLETYRYLIGESGSREEIASSQISHGNYDYEKQTQRRLDAWLLIAKAQSVINKIIRYLPNIMLVAVSGGTGALDSKDNSDIDLFVICKPHTKWLTRASLLIYFRLSNQLVNTTFHNNQNHGRFCVNLIIEDIPEELNQTEQDLYTCMEIAHLKVVFNRQHSFQRFINANAWIANFLPNWWTITQREWELNSDREKLPQQPRLFIVLINFGLRLVQQTYYQLRHHRKLSTRNFIYDYRNEILSKYNEISVK